jgi:hypothetical protein
MDTILVPLKDIEEATCMLDGGHPTSFRGHFAP